MTQHEAYPLDRSYPSTCESTHEARAPSRRSALLDVSSSEESVAGTRNCVDVPRLAPVVLRLRSESSHVPVDDVALDDEVGAPQRVEDLLPGEDAPAGSLTVYLSHPNYVAQQRQLTIAAGQTTTAQISVRRSP